MPTPFDRLDRLASRAVDRLNAQRFVLRPRKKLNPQSRPVADDDRPVVEGRGVFEYMSVDKGLQLGVRKTYREANDLKTLQVGREPVISIDRTVYFPNGAPLPKQDDIIEIPDDPGQPDFFVVSVKPDGQARVVLVLNVKGAG